MKPGTVETRNTDTATARSLLTVDEAAKVLSISVRLVRRLVTEERLPTVRIGRAVRIDPARLEKQLAGGAI